MKQRGTLSVGRGDETERLQHDYQCLAGILFGTGGRVIWRRHVAANEYEGAGQIAE